VVEITVTASIWKIALDRYQDISKIAADLNSPLFGEAKGTWAPKLIYATDRGRELVSEISEWLSETGIPFRGQRVGPLWFIELPSQHHGVALQLRFV
jgi:lysyl-tRNA synthetase class I